MLNCGWDTETYLIGAPDNMIPRKVCGSWDMAPQGQRQAMATMVWSTGDGVDLWDQTYAMWQSANNAQTRIIIQNAAFDICVALRYCKDVGAGLQPGRQDQAEDLYHLIWGTLERSLDSEWAGGPVLVSDTMLREQLFNLSSHGSIIADSYGREIRYSLADLAYRHLRIDARAKKVKLGPNGTVLDYTGKDITGTPAAGEAWRLRYCELDGVPVAQWPLEAYTYALEDSTLARLIWESQEAKASKTGNHRTIRSESLQVYSAVCLQMVTASGFRLDHNQVSRIESEICGELSQIEPTLRANGFLRANGSVNKKVVQEAIERVCKEHDLTLQMTENEDNPQIAMGKEALQLIAPFDPKLDAFARRQILAKLRDAFLPHLRGDRVYTKFDTLKETGRTSSTGASTRGGRVPLFPAVNCQQIPRREGIRECFLPCEPGYLLGSVDYGALELCSVAQTTHRLVQPMGKVSIHREKINAGYDLHSYLGSAAAALKEPQLVGHQTLSPEAMDNIYFAFMDNLKYRAPQGYVGGDSTIDDRVQLAKRAKHFRNYAKPTGLGYPGGLGPNTMVIFSRTTYGVQMTREDAEEMKELWLTVYPEMVDYFKWVRDQRDHKHTVDPKNPRDVRYCYITPGFNRFRAGCFYCSAANGAAMQSLSADGAKRSVCWIGRAAAGGLQGDNPFRILDKCFNQAFIHDENLVAYPDDTAVTERAFATNMLMVQAMQMHMPDVRISAEPALMTKWSKAAEPEWVVDPQGQERAWYQLASEYGPDLATGMMDMFSPKDGRRLVPFDRREK